MAGRVGVLPMPGADLGVDAPRAGGAPACADASQPLGAWVLIPPLLPAADRRAWRQVFTLQFPHMKHVSLEKKVPEVLCNGEGFGVTSRTRWR